MACTGCGASSCRGCKDMKVILPEGRGISTITDNGNGTWTITYNDATTQIINAAGAVTVPTDNWVQMDETTVASFTWAGTATLNTSSLDIAYKITDAQTVVMIGVMSCNVTVTGLSDSINFNYQMIPISSNWYAGTKKLSTVIGAGVIQNHAKVSIITVAAAGSVPNQIGRIYTGTVGANTLVALASTNLQLPNGTYNIIVDFQITSKLA